MKKILFLSMVVILIISVISVFSFVGCKATTTTETTVAAKKIIRIGALWCLMSVPSVQAVNENALQKAKEIGNIEVIPMDGNWDGQKQSDQMLDLISQKVDAIILNPVDGVSIIPAVKKAKEAGIPIILACMQIDKSAMDLVTTFVGADAYDMGKVAAEEAIKIIGNKEVKFAQIGDKSGTELDNNTSLGFEENVAKSNIKLIDKQPGDNDRAKAMAVMEDFLVKYSDLGGVFVHDDVMAMGAASAIKNAGKTKDIVVICGTGLEESLSMIKDGFVNAMAYRFITQEGGMALQAAYDLATGKTVHKWIKCMPIGVDKDNVNSDLKIQVIYLDSFK